MRESDEKKNHDTYRCESDSWSDDEDSSSTSSDTSGSDFFQMVVESSSAPKNIPEIKTHGELGLDDLPPIEDLVISIPQEDMMLIGHIHAVVGKLVVVHAIQYMEPLDIDSVLFLTNDKPLGRVYDVFGPVVEPYYCVRFNSVDDINKKIIEIGADVFFAPKENEITSYVFVDELQKQKGSDASWKFNNEPPEEYLDFSDDEQEKAAKRKRMAEIRNRRFSSSSDIAAKRPALMNDSDSQQNFRSNHRFPPCIINVPNVINIPTDSTVIPFSRAYSCPPSPSPSISSVFEVPISTPFSNSYPSHHFSSPSPSISNALVSPRFTPFSSSCAPFPSSSVPCLPRPPSPTPSVCSLISVSVRARTPSGNFSTPRQPLLTFSQRSFSPQNAPQRASMLSSNFQPYIQRTTSPYRSPSPFMLQSHQQSHLQRSFSPQNAIQQPALPPENVMEASTFALQNEIQRPALQLQPILPRPTCPPPLPPYQQTHLFGQVTLINPLSTLQPPSLPPLPISIARFVPPPVIPTNFFSPGNPRGPPPYPNPSPYSPVPPHHPLTIEIPNINSPSISLNHHQVDTLGSNTIFPIKEESGQTPLY